MKNITVALPEQTARWVRVWAAEQNKSVSAALAELIEEKKREGSMRRRSLESFFGSGPANISGGQPYPSRESLHER
jgi:hypothetical protein